MLRAYLKSAAILFLVILMTSTVFASGKMEVPLGEKVTLQAETVQTGGSYKWVIKKGRDIINTQTGTLFNYTFDVQGEYTVNLTATDKAGATKDTTVTILVGNRYSAPTGSGSSGSGVIIDTPLDAEVETLPVTTSEKTVYIAGDEGRVVFDMATRPDILEYRIDRNVYIDSDGDGIANNDIDNADHSSYLLGGVWQTKYKASESNKIAAEVTVVNTQGAKAKTQVEVLFGSTPAKEGKVVAILDTLPILDQDDKKIYVYGDKDTVAFYSRRSQGDIIEYRIDKNVFVDSDGDGNPANDIDNRTDISFKSGDVWTTEYEKTDEQIIAQLIAVGSGGTGSRIQREIVFTNAPEVEYTEAPAETETVIQLVADKEFVQKGDPVVFTVEGLMQDLGNYTFDWDFNGDDEVDQTVEGNNTVSYIYDKATIQPVKVRVIDTGGNEATFTLDFLVKDIVSTKADFDYEIDGLTIDFTNLSAASQNLTNQVLDYTWSFGDTDPDNYEAQRDKIGVENPTYNYSAPGTYIVSLTVVDSDQVTDTKSIEILLEAPEGYSPEAQEGGEGDEVVAKTEKEGSLIGSIFKIILYVVLIIIILVVAIVFGLLAFLKIQNPDLVFEELIDELKIKILSVMGVHEVIEPIELAEGTAEAPAPEEIPSEPEAQAPEEPAEEPDLSKPDAPMPDWLKPGGTPAKVETPVETPQSDVIEGEVEEEAPAEPEPEPTPEPKPAPEPEPTPEPAPEPKTPAPMPENPVAEESQVSEPAPAPEPEAPASEKPAEGGEELNKNDGPVPDWLK